MKRVRKLDEFGKPRKVTWDEHCVPEFWFGVVLLAVLGSVFSFFALYSDLPGSGPDSAKTIFLIFLAAIVVFALVTKHENNAGRLWSSEEVQLSEMSDDTGVAYDELATKYNMAVSKKRESNNGSKNKED